MAEYPGALPLSELEMAEAELEEANGHVRNVVEELNAL